jgi:bZIP-type transcription factor MBZ1
LEENTRLSDLTRMLLSSPSFSGFLDTLTPNVAAAPQQAAPAPAEQAPVENRQIRKDINPYAAQQQMQNQRINLALLPEQNMDFSMLDITGDGFNYQPQVFSVLEMPEVAIDTTVLSGKISNFVGASFDSDDEKVKLPVIERMPVKEIAPIEIAPVVDEEFDADPTFALFSHATSAKSQSESPLDLELTPIFGGIESEKALARIELVDAATTEVTEAIAMARVERLCSSLDDVAARLEMMTLHL